MFWKVKLEVLKLYPQFNNDRRQQNIPIDKDRRSSLDRRVNINAELRQDLKQVKDTFEIFRNPKHTDSKKDSFKNIEAGALSAIPFIRRFNGVQEAWQHGESFKSLGKAFIQIINVKGDWGDLKKAFKEIINLDFKKHEYQKPFGFFRDTYLENLQPKNKKLAAILDKAYEFDKTVFNFPIIQKLLAKLGGKPPEFIEDSIKMNGSLISKILGRAFLRVPVLSLIFIGALEIPAIYKAENKDKQFVKSTINIISFISCGAILGAVGAYAGAFGSLVSLGVGSYLGNKLADKINSNI